MCTSSEIRRDDDEHHHRQAVDQGADGELDGRRLDHQVTVFTTADSTARGGPPRPAAALARRVPSAGRLAAPSASCSPAGVDVLGVAGALEPLHAGGSDSTKHDAERQRCRSPSRPDGSRLPKNRISDERDRRDERDDPGVLQEPASGASALHQVDLVEVDAPAVAVDEQDDGQADADLGGGDGDDEQGEHLAGDRRR